MSLFDTLYAPFKFTGTRHLITNQSNSNYHVQKRVIAIQDHVFMGPYYSYFGELALISTRFFEFSFISLVISYFFKCYTYIHIMSKCKESSRKMPQITLPQKADTNLRGF